MNYSAKIEKENLGLIEAALDVATEEVKNKRRGWARKVSSFIINAYLFMLAAIHHF